MRDKLSITENNRKWWIFFAMAAALSVVFLDQTAIVVALSPMQKDMNMSNVSVQWVINAYLLSLAALVIFAGKLGDVCGHKRIFLSGISIFVISSASCALAPSTTWLIMSRAIQGIGGAFMVPVTGVMIAHAFAENERGKAMGLYVAVASTFLSLGPFVSGLLVHYLNWRWIFWVNLPVSIFSITLTVLAVPASEDRREEKKPLDWLGFLTFSIFITSLVMALMEGVNLGWHSLEITVLFIIAVCFMVIFFIIETKAKDPIVYLPLFKQKSFLAANLCILLFTCAFSSYIFWAILLQNVMGYSSIMTGLFYLPVTLPVMFMAPWGGKLRDQYGPRLPTMLGSMAVILGALWMAFSAFKGHYSIMLPGFVLFGLGPALIYSSTMTTSISSVPLSKMGMASGISNGMRQVGRVLGVAVIGSVISNVEQYQLAHTKTDLPSYLQILSTKQLMSLLANSPYTKNTLARLSPVEAHHTYTLLKSVFTFAFSIGMIAAALLVVGAWAIALFLPNKPMTKSEPK